MGKEASCSARYGAANGAGKLHLETDQLLFRGAFRLAVPLKQIRRAQAANGSLRVDWADETAEFELGAAAEKWADALNNPKSLLDKLGVKPEHKVSVLAVRDDAFLEDLQRRAAEVTLGRVVKGADLIFFQADEPGELKALSKLAGQIQPAGAIWVITPKKRPEIADTVVMKAGHAAGLVDVKVARFSDSHTTLKFVIPRQNR